MKTKLFHRQLAYWI